jgi:DNA-3-methyladenine glycosylase
MRARRGDLSQNDTDLLREPFLLLGPDGEPPPVVVGPRIGITKAVERPWRFCAAGNPFVSRPWPIQP